MLKHVYFIPEGDKESRHLVEAREEGADWWEALSEEERNEIRAEAKQAFDQNIHVDPYKNERYSYQISQVRDMGSLRTGPWWDGYIHPRDYLDKRGATYYNPDTGELLDQEGQQGKER